MRIEVLPNLMTGANLALGMVAIVYAIEGRYVTGALAVLVAALLDRFDGKLARKLDNCTEFGREMDSLADLVSFGVAPAILVYLSKLNSLGMPGLILMILFVLCGALRLARFNVMNVSEFFLGIPITIAGSLLAVMILLAGSVHVMIDATLMFILAIFMVSTIKLPKI